MTLQFLHRFRHKDKTKQQQKDNAGGDPPSESDPRVLLAQVGIYHDTCKANGNIRDCTAMPLPPPRRPLTPPKKLPRDISSAAFLPVDIGNPFNEDENPVLPQNQSLFFSCLPQEIRRRIYIELFGSRSVHLEYDFGYAPGYRHRDKRPPDQWRWWHRVCDDEDPKPGDMCRTSDLENTKRLGRAELLKHKLKGVSWLRACRKGYQEALPILYSSNTFLISSSVKLCRLPKMIVPSHLSRITSLDVLHVAKATTPSTMSEDNWEAYYTIFRTLRLAYSGVRRLRLVIHILNKSCTPRAGTVPEELEDAWFRPWQELASCRRWEKLEIGVQDSWFEDFSAAVRRWEDRSGRRPQMVGYSLVKVEDFTTWDGKLSEIWNAVYL